MAAFLSLLTAFRSVAELLRWVRGRQVEEPELEDIARACRWTGCLGRCISTRLPPRILVPGRT
jgi:hypothetical protein